MQIDNEEVKLVLSKNIKLARNILGLTQETLSEKAEISLSFLKDVESTRSSISLSTLISLCQSLETTPNQLLKSFFVDSVDTSNNILQQINLLSDYQRNAILTLIHYFNTHNSNKTISKD